MVAASDFKDVRTNLKYRFFSLASFKEFFSFENSTSNEGFNYLIFPFNVDKSCCGSNNTSIFKETDSFIDSIKKLGSTFSFFVFGFRGKNYFQAKYPKASIRCLNGIHINNMSNLLTYEICFFSINLDFDKFVFIFNKMTSIFDIKPYIYEIYSYDKWLLLFNETSSSFILDILINYDRLSDLYFFGMSLFLLDSFIENEYSSMAGRLNTITNACNNIKTIIDSTRRIFNRARQEQITASICEIVSCTL